MVGERGIVGPRVTDDNLDPVEGGVGQLPGAGARAGGFLRALRGIPRLNAM
jgi:hypothetical protein